MSDKKPVVEKQAQSRTLQQRWKELINLRQKGRELAGGKEYRKEMQGIRTLDSELREAARQMKRMMPMARRAMLMRKYDQLAATFDSMLEQTEDLAARIKELGLQAVPAPSESSSAADDSHDFIGKLQDWWAERAGEAAERRESRPGRTEEQVKQQRAREFYQQMEAFKDDFVKQMDVLADLRTSLGEEKEGQAGTNADQYIRIVNELAKKREALQEPYKKFKEDLGIATDEAPKPSEKPTAEEPAAEEPAAEEPAAEEPVEQQASYSDVLAAGLWQQLANIWPSIIQQTQAEPAAEPAAEGEPAAAPVEEPAPTQEPNESDTDHAVEIMQKVVERAQAGQRVPKSWLADLQKVQQMFGGQQAAPQQGAPMVVQQGHKELLFGKRGVAAALYLKASQMYEEEGLVEESIKTLALAERILGIRRTGG